MADERPNAQEAVEDAFREGWGSVVASLARETGDLGLAEDATQEAFTAALLHWPESGVPDRPVAWLRVAARRKAIDRLRQERRVARTAEVLQVLVERDLLAGQRGALAAG